MNDLMMRLQNLTITFLLMTLSYSSLAASKKVLHWYEFDLPPYHIKEGANKRKGLSQVIQQSLIDSMPQYRHTTRFANTTRTFNDIAIKDNVCAFSLIKTPRTEQTMHLSKPWLLIMSNGLSIRKNDLEKYARYIQDGYIDLDLLMQNTNFKLGTIKSRPYGDYLDGLLLKFKRSNKIKVIGGSAILPNLLTRLIKSQQIDGVLGYATEVKYFTKEYDTHGESTVFIPVQHAQKTYSAYMGCSKTPFGAQVIADANKLIEKNAHIYQQRYRAMLGNKTAQYYDTLLKQRAEKK